MGEKRIRALVTMVMLTALVIIGGGGCGSDPSPSTETQLARVGSRIITVRDFNRAFEISKAAYSHNEIQDPDLAREVRFRLLNQMIEEAMLLDQADAQQIELTQEEFDEALADIREDYPEDSFEQMLLESAISYVDWKEMLRNRLIIDKLIDRVLGEKIVINPQEIRDYYRRQGDGANRPVMASGQGDDSGDADDRIIIAKIRRQKLEQAYKAWMADLNQKYAVDINTAQWQALTGSTRTGFEGRRVKTQDRQEGPEPDETAPGAKPNAEQDQRSVP